MEILAPKFVNVNAPLLSNHTIWKKTWIDLRFNWKGQLLWRHDHPDQILVI
jgi:hypothetical protein